MPSSKSFPQARKVSQAYPAVRHLGRAQTTNHRLRTIRATALFHGHAHNGMTDGKTSTGIPVYNVSAPALHKTGKPYRIIEL
jgi:hypothetical protein